MLVEGLVEDCSGVKSAGWRVGRNGSTILLLYVHGPLFVLLRHVEDEGLPIGRRWDGLTEVLVEDFVGREILKNVARLVCGETQSKILEVCT